MTPIPSPNICNIFFLVMPNFSVQPQVIPAGKGWPRLSDTPGAAGRGWGSTGRGRGSAGWEIHGAGMGDPQPGPGAQTGGCGAGAAALSDVCPEPRGCAGRRGREAAEVEEEEEAKAEAGRGPCPRWWRRTWPRGSSGPGGCGYRSSSRWRAREPGAATCALQVPGGAWGRGIPMGLGDLLGVRGSTVCLGEVS